jgi:trans-aconitate methyltransferase
VATVTGLRKERRKNDAYYTDPRLTRAICERLGELLPPPERVLEPSMGGGAFVQSTLERWPAAKVVGCDIDRRCRKIAKDLGIDFVAGDFRRATSPATSTWSSATLRS